MFLSRRVIVSPHRNSSVQELQAQTPVHTHHVAFNPEVQIVQATLAVGCNVSVGLFAFR